LKTDNAYAEKYNKVIEVKNEINRCENNIRKNYHFVDNVIIPQLKAISSTFKAHQKKYIKMKKVQEEHREDLKNLEFKLQKLESQIKLKLRYKNPSATSLHNEHYQIQPDKEEYFQD
jgi:hypothetical protein